MWNLFREIPVGKTYAGLIAESPNVNFDYFVSLNAMEPNTDKLESIEDWDKYWVGTPEQYAVTRIAIQVRAQAVGWATLTHDEKMVAIKYRAFPDDVVTAGTIVGYLMGIGYTQAEAVGTLIQAGAAEQTNLIKACHARGTSPVLFMIVGKYLALPDQADLNELVDSLLNKFLFRGLRGTLDGRDGNQGLFDFIEGTAGITTLADQLYVMQNGDADMSNFIAELMNWLRNGVTTFTI